MSEWRECRAPVLPVPPGVKIHTRVHRVHSNANYFTHRATAFSLATVTAAAEAIERGVNKRARKLALRPHAVAGG